MRGTVLYFDDCNSKAFIWPQDTQRTIAVLHRADFPRQWPLLAIGTEIDIEVSDGNFVCRVTRILGIDGASAKPHRDVVGA